MDGCSLKAEICSSMPIEIERRAEGHFISCACIHGDFGHIAWSQEVGCLAWCLMSTGGDGWVDFLGESWAGLGGAKANDLPLCTKGFYY